MFEYGPPTHHPLLVRSSETISEVPAKVLIRAWTGTAWWNGWKLVLLFTLKKKKSLRLQIQPVQFCNSAESYPRVYVSWTWKGGRCRGPSWGHWSRERWCVCAPCCAPALKLDFHLHTVHTRPMQSCQETAIAKHERCTFSNDGKFYLDFFLFFLLFHLWPAEIKKRITRLNEWNCTRWNIVRVRRTWRSPCPLVFLN